MGFDPDHERPARNEKGTTHAMKSTSPPKAKTSRANGLQPEYRFDYTKAKPNRFAKCASGIRPSAREALNSPELRKTNPPPADPNT